MCFAQMFLVSCPSIWRTGYSLPSIVAGSELCVFSRIKLSKRIYNDDLPKELIPWTCNRVIVFDKKQVLVVWPTIKAVIRVKLVVTGGPRKPGCLKIRIIMRSFSAQFAKKTLIRKQTICISFAVSWTMIGTYHSMQFII